MYNKSAILTKMLVLALSAVLLSGCGETAQAAVDEQPTVTTVQEKTDMEEYGQDEIIPEAEDETAPVVEEPEEDKYPDATIKKTGDNSYVMHIDCPDNSDAEIIAQTANIRNFDEYSIGAESDGISKNLTTAIAAYGMQIDSNNVYQINYDAYMDKPFTIIDPSFKYFGSDPQLTSVITNNPSAYPDMRIYTRIPNDGVLAGTLLRSCLDDTQNVSLALLKYFAGPDAYDQIIAETMNNTGCTYEEICANYDANYVLQYDTQGLVDHNCINGVLQYIAPDDLIKIKYYDDEGKLLRTDSYTIERN